MKRFALLFVVFLVAAPAAAQPAQKRPMQVDDLFKFKRVADPRTSPDAKWVVYSVATIEDVAKNKSSANLWLASTDGKVRKQLTATTKKDRQARWSPDGKSVLFVSTRSGTPQLWIIDTGGGE